MSETIVVGILTAAAALSGFLIQGILDERRRHSEEKRWYADYFLGRKIDSLATLYSELSDWQYAINLHGNVPPRTFEEYKSQVYIHEVAFRKAMVIAKVYLDTDAEQVIGNTFAKFSIANLAIGFSLPDKEIPNVMKASYHDDKKRVQWEQVNDSFTKASECLGNLLNPDILNQFQAWDQKNRERTKDV